MLRHWPWPTELRPEHPKLNCCRNPDMPLPANHLNTVRPAHRACSLQKQKPLVCPRQNGHRSALDCCCSQFEMHRHECKWQQVILLPFSVTASRYSNWDSLHFLLSVNQSPVSFFQENLAASPCFRILHMFWVEPRIPAALFGIVLQFHMEHPEIDSLADR